MEPLITIEELKTIGNFEGIVLMPRMLPFKTKFLPDYQIDWGISFENTNIPERKMNNICQYKED